MKLLMMNMKNLFLILELSDHLYCKLQQAYLISCYSLQ